MFLYFSRRIAALLFFRWLHQWTPPETVDLEPWVVATLHRTPIEVVVVHIGELPGTHQDHGDST